VLTRPPATVATLPTPSADALAASEALASAIAADIAAAGGWIGFDRFMELALYKPGMGYYAGGSRKFGAAGDFVTAPELSPTFAQTLAVQLQQLQTCCAARLIEVGGGSGRLASDLLLELERQRRLPESYAILELSGGVRRRAADSSTPLPSGHHTCCRGCAGSTSCPGTSAVSSWRTRFSTRCRHTSCAGTLAASTNAG